MFVTLRGEPCLSWRAVDVHSADWTSWCKGGAIRALPNASSCAYGAQGWSRARWSPTNYAATRPPIPELANVKHVFVEAAARLDNRTENRHQPTRESRMCGFRDPKRAQKFLSCCGPIRQHSEAPTAARFALSHTAPCPICRLSRIYRHQPKSVDPF
jgi:putative transposase